MKNVSFIVGLMLVSVLLVSFPVGYIANIVKLSDCDFKAPYKAEIIRGVGIVIPPVGYVVGFI